MRECVKNSQAMTTSGRDEELRLQTDDARLRWQWHPDSTITTPLSTSNELYRPGIEVYL